MKSVRTMMATLLVAGLAAPLLAGELGAKAPKLEIADWVKGQPVDVTSADGKHVYVVEFWATWCGPCKQSIPHLTEMQKKYADKNVVFIGVSDEKVDTVKPFVEAQGDKMDYTVVVDKDKKTSKAYMGEYGINGIPHAFIVDQKGRIVWHDHPMAGIEKVIDEVVAGTFDLEAAKKEMQKREEQAKRAQAVFMMVNKYIELASSAGKAKEAAELGAKLLADAGDDANLLNAFAWEVLTNENIVERDLKLALKAAKQANDLTDGENASILDTYALALYENDQKEEAVKTQRKAVELAKDNPEMLKELKERLERFEKGK